jgi:hypothetical protein
MILRLDHRKGTIFPGHKKSFYDLTLANVAFHDFCDISFFPNPIPDAFGINDHTWPIFTLVQASGFVGPDNAL